MKTLTRSRRNFLVSLLALGAAAPFARRALAASGSTMEVWKDPQCGCCGEWIGIVRAAGFNVVVNNAGNDRARAKARIGVQYASCHTAFVEGYAIEGHVPVREIRRLLKERPAAIGLAVPGMPQGSPGMEQGRRPDPYSVLLLHKDGSSSTYAKYPG